MEPIINIRLGSSPVTQRVIETAKETYMTARNWTAAMRDDAMVEDSFARRGWMLETPNYDRILPALASFENALIWTMQINTTNAIVQEYLAAEVRLSRYILAEGREEVTEEQETGKFNSDGTPHTETVIVLEEILPLPATVDVVNGEGETIVTPNLAIERDEAERQAAQSVIDNAPAAVHAIPCIYPGDENRLTDYFISVQ